MYPMKTNSGALATGTRMSVVNGIESGLSLDTHVQPNVMDDSPVTTNARPGDVDRESQRIGLDA